MIEVLDSDEMEFQKAGGDVGIVLRLLGSAFKWLGIGFFFHLGWRLAAF